MSKLLSEDENFLYLRDYLHGQSDSLSAWELDDKGEMKYPQFIHEAEHYALYEISVEYKINKKTGAIEYTGFDI